MKKVTAIVIIAIITVLSSLTCTTALAVGEIGATSAANYGDPEGYWNVAYTSIAPLGFEPTKTFKKSWGVWDSTDPYAWEKVALQLNKLGQSKAATSLRPLTILAVYAVNGDKRVRVDKGEVQGILDDLTEKVVREFTSPSAFKLNGKKTTGTRTLYACNIETLSSKHTLEYVLVLPDGQELGVYSRPWTKADKVVAIDGLVWVLTLKKGKSSGSGSGTPSKPSTPQDHTPSLPPVGEDHTPSLPPVSTPEQDDSVTIKVKVPQQEDHTPSLPTVQDHTPSLPGM